MNSQRENAFDRMRLCITSGSNQVAEWLPYFDAYDADVRLLFQISR